MVKVRPFKGFLANQENAAKVISPAYDTLNTAEARIMADGNPMSFLNVNKPEITLPEETDPYADEVYTTGRANLEHFIEQGYLVQDNEERMYIYQQTMGDHTQYGVIGLASVDDYEQNRIKRHEHTLAKKEADRTKLTDVQSANVGPVFLTFRENQEAIKSRMSQIVTDQAPYGDVTCEDGVRHVLWQCSTEDSEYFVQQFANIQALYVADGHHRTAAAFNVGKLRKQRAIDAGIEVTGEEPFNYFMTLFYPADNLMILDYNRVLKSLNDMSTEEFKGALEENFIIRPLADGETSKVQSKHSYSLFIDNKWHVMSIKPDKIDYATPVTQLDSQIINKHVLEEILGITDIKRDNRVDFVGGIRGHQELVRRCETDCIAAIAMHPCQIDELLDVAEADLIMPPKSTWFEPKPRSGFVVRVFD